ncbi:hypothetical protein ERC79_13615 [Rhodococcus sp. ABRD24]|uniref:prenyltransferase/squalene oxidase repeat-containing protein n=1 Tax=Rhodococcus sp. ABRD24 TaxID=2507582 RepID=UPI001038BCA8|nr:prenyltransferase/squalene oxidase repeat-containing protein [Rhodococcus sp. ABRD24]QBJ96871.1 hypothetical protein ERC79_13615 [Rhodococcus sp. ABRD24]
MIPTSLRADAPRHAVDLADLAVTGGGFRSNQLDLFASHSATAALSDIQHRPASHLMTARAVLSRASARGMGETIGAQEDAWSTTYGSGILFNLGYVAPPAWASFLSSLEQNGGYAMFPGGKPDAWATGFAALAQARYDPTSVRKAPLARWIGSAQASDGGITWTPEQARRGSGDVRATGFCVEALRQVAAVPLLAGYADIEALATFVIGQQIDAGGFALDSHSAPCMWGTGEAVAVLDALEIPIPNRTSVIEFVMAHFDEATGGFRRGPAYHTQADVWATRQAVRVLRVVAPDRLATLAPRVVSFVESCELPHGGYTYTNVTDAGDVLSTSAALLAGYGTSQTADWIASCMMPDDDGFAYMPGRGAEARTSQWATAALDAAGISYNADALLTWASRMQNLDGGFGRWAGRVSEPVSTAAVVATLARTDMLGSFPGLGALANWVGNAIEGLDDSRPVDAVTTANLVRAANAITGASDASIDITPCLSIIRGLRVDGAFRRSTRAVPDLATTYAVLVAHQSMGDEDSLPAARSWLNHLTVHPNGVAWSPASSEGGGLLATALAALIANAADGARLPDLSL